MGSGSEKPVLFEVRVDTKTGEIDLKRFQGTAIKSMNEVDKSTKGLLSSIGGIKGAFGLASTAVAGYFAAVGATAALRSFVGLVQDGVASATQQELAERKLVTALQARGLAVDEMLSKMKAWAGQAQFQIGVDDDAILSSQALAIQFGATAAQASRLTTAAADAATALGRDFSSVSFAITRAISTGSAVALTRLGIKLDATVLKSRDVNKILEAVEKKFGGSAAASLKTFDGAVRILNMSWSEFKETLGEVIVRSPSVRALLEGLASIVQRLGVSVATDNDLLKPFVEALVRLAIVIVKLASSVSITTASFDEWRVSMVRLVATIAPFVPMVRDAILALSLLQKASDPGEPTALDEKKKFWEGVLADLESTLKTVQETSGKLAAPTAQPGINVVEGGIKTLKEQVGFGVDEVLALADSVKKLDVAFKALEAGKSSIPAEAYEASVRKLREEAQKLSELGAKPAWFKGLTEALAIAEKSQAFIDMDKQIQNLLIQEKALNDLLVAGSISADQHAIAMKGVTDQYHQLAEQAIKAGAAIKPLSEITPPESPLNDIGVGFDPSKIPDMAPLPAEVMADRTENAKNTLEAQMKEIERINASAIATWQGQTMVLAGTSQVFAENWTAMYDAIGSAADAMNAAGFEKAAAAIRKVQAAMLLVTSVIAIAEGAIKIATGIYPPNPPQIASGAAMMAKGAAGLAQARAMGASGAGSKTSAGGSSTSAGGGIPAVDYSGAVRTGLVTGTTPVVAGTANKQQAQVVTNNYYDVKAIDARSFRDFALEPQNRRTLREANDLEVGRR